MRATEICGEVFCEIWAVFLTVAFRTVKCGISLRRRRRSF